MLVIKKKQFSRFFRKELKKINQFEEQSKKPKEEKLYTRLEINIAKIKEKLGHSADVSTRIIDIGQENNIDVGLLYTEGLVDTLALQNLIDSLFNKAKQFDLESFNDQDLITSIRKKAITIGDVDELKDFDNLITNILSGHVALLIDYEVRAITVNIFKQEKRNVEEPQSSTLIKGPREGFTETLGTNTALLRKRIRNSNLWLESKEIGKMTKTKVIIAYINGIVNKDVLKELHQRLDKIDIDAILETGYIEELIKEESYSPFPTMYSTERPDAVASKLLEGRVAVLVDGSPFVIVVPSLMIEFFQASEDYYQQADIATLLRLLRFFCFFIACLAPSLYVAILTYHQEMLPTQLLISIAAQREGVPFPAIFEAIIMEIAFEILREAGVRMPRAVGQAMSIVGAIVLGQAAVQAGLVSNAMIIVVSLTAIANFCIPAINFSTTIRMIRFGMMGFAATFGLMGILFGVTFLCIHLCKLKSFGIPYTASVAPFILQDQKDVFFRFPIWSMLSRPRLISRNNTIRQRHHHPLKKTGEKS